MVAILPNMVEKFLEVFMDDFSIYGNSFDLCLHPISLMLKQCEETNLVLNWENCHFMFKKGIILGHWISSNGIEVDRAKVKTIRSFFLPNLLSVVDVF